MRGAALVLLMSAAPALAQDALALVLPDGARQVLQDIRPDASHDLPIGPFAGFLPTDPREGQVTQRVWQIPGDAPTLRLLAPLRTQVIAAGFVPLFACRDAACGGYDFRFATDIAPPPEMQVNLTDFHFLSAARGAERLSLLVSRAGDTGFVQMIHVAPMGTPGPETDQTAATPTSDRPAQTGARDIADQLRQAGRVVLEDLSFATGAAELGPGPFASLQALARFLAADPAARVALVGHTDATGPLDGNIALSERRAAAVLDRLVAEYGVAPSRIEARGVGSLAPLAPSTTPEGRDRNRRVEAVLLAGG